MKSDFRFEHFIGRSPALQNVLRAAQMVAPTDASILICGETGTGKEILAQAIHNASLRKEKPYIAINCAALPDGLAESELFGHRRGAFTGADSNRQGYIRSVSEGTLFLDEVGELSLSTQARLLRFLESGECQCVGDEKPSHVNVRIIAASNRDLQAEVEAGRFRRDLYYRLQVVPLELPPLRERVEDILPLAEHFFLSFQRNSLRVWLEKNAEKVFKQYRWPGNVRELRNLCERLSILSPGRMLDAQELPAELSRVKRPSVFNLQNFQLPAEGLVLEQVEQDLIQQALCKTDGNKSKAARLLGLTRDTLLYRMKKYAMR